MSAPPLFRGEWISNEEADYVELAGHFNQRIHHAPAVIARCRGAADVVEALRYARERQLPVAVRSTGYSLAGHSSTDGVLIDLGLMRGVRVDPVTQTAWVGGGASGGDIQIEASVHGLAGATGMLSGTGVGLILGGGVGHLSRRVGYASDNVLAVELVTASGSIVTASPESHPDLFWAVRGTSGAFGVVTAVQLQLHPVPEAVVAGAFSWTGDDIRPAISAFQDAVGWASDDLNLLGMVMPGEFQVWICHSGEPTAADAEVDRFLASAPATADERMHLTFPELVHLYDADFGPQRVALDEETVDEITDDVVDVLLAAVNRPLPAGSAAARKIELPPRFRGLSRAPRHPSALHDGDIAPCWSIAPGAWWTDATEDEEHILWVQNALEELRRIGCTTGLLQPTYLGLDSSGDRMRAVFGANYERLRDLKTQWDPDDVFASTIRIPPRS